MTYVVINLAASTLLVATIALIYAATGSLNMADVAVKLDERAPRAATRSA
jgi:multicomponent Na+:H+ antiporter subunit D